MMIGSNIDNKRPGTILVMVPNVALFLLTLATTFSYCRIFAGWEFFWQYIIVAIGVHFCSYFFRRIRLPFLLACVASILVTYTLTMYLYLRPTLTYGLPLFESWDQAWDQMSRSWDQLGDVVPPVALHSGFGLAGAFSIGLIAFLIDSFAFRFSGRIEIAIPPVIVFITLAAVGTDRHRIVSSVLWIVTACLAVAILRIPRSGIAPVAATRSVFRARYGRQLLTILTLATAAGLMAGIIAPKIPGATRPAWLSTRDSKMGSELSPLIDLADQLINPSDDSLFTVITNRPSYWRVTSLPDFDGTTWTVEESLLNEAGGTLFDTTTITDVGVSVTQQSQQIIIDNLSSTFAPSGLRPTQLVATSRNLFYESDTGTLLVDSSGLTPRDSYSLISTVVVPSAESLATSRSNFPPRLAYSRLPQTSQAADEIARLQPILDQIVAGYKNNYERLLAIQSYFRDNFLYTLEVPVAPISGATAAFIERRSGFCEQFASTFALFARMIGIPSRVAIGFTPGQATPVGTSELSSYEVRSQHAHAWPEVWFDDIGWVLFEPTPGRGAPQANYTNVQPAQDESPTNSAATTLPDTAETTTSVTATQPANSSSSLPVSTAVDSAAESSSETPQPKSNDSNLKTFFFLALLLLLFSWVLLVPRWAELQARKVVPNNHLRIWRSTISRYEFIHGPISPQSTVTDVTQLLAQQPWIDPARLETLTAAMTALLYRSRRSLGIELDTSQTSASFESSNEPTLVDLQQWKGFLSWRQHILCRINPMVAVDLAGGRRSGNASPSS